MAAHVVNGVQFPYLVGIATFGAKNWFVNHFSSPFILYKFLNLIILIQINFLFFSFFIYFIH